MIRILLIATLVTFVAAMLLMYSIVPGGYYLLIFCATVSAQITAKKWLS